jgi:HAD superfamily hydrolase (TIGR01509 family)
MLTTLFLDNDGVLVDTEKYYFEANREICGNYGHRLDRDEYGELFLKTNKGVRHIFKPQGFSDKQIETLRGERDALYASFLRTREIGLPGVEEGLRRLAERFALCMVTTAPRACIDIIHNRTGFLPYFKKVVTEEDVVRHKPDPEPYLVAMKKMAVVPDRSIAFEDTQRGVVSAASAGLRCVVIPHALTEGQDFSRAVYRAGNFTDAVEYCMSILRDSNF